MENRQLTNSVGHHARIIAVFILFSIYVLLELSLNLTLVDLYSRPMDEVFGPYFQVASDVELFGRILSSFGIALVIIGFVPVGRADNIASTATGLSAARRRTARRLFRFVLFLAIWAALVPSLRLAVDGWVNVTSNEKKLNAVRAVIYKEAYQRNDIRHDGLEQLDTLAADTSRRDLVMALIPSLVYYSYGFNKLVERNTEALTDTFMQNNQKQIFAEQGLPRLRDFDRLYQQELKQYQQASAAYTQALRAMNSTTELSRQTDNLIKQTNDFLLQHWNRYADSYEAADKQFKGFGDIRALRQTHHKFKDRHNSSKCNSTCRQQVKEENAHHLNGIIYEGKRLDIKVLPDDTMFSILGTAERIEFMLTQGRKRWLRQAFGVNEEETFEQFIQTDSARGLAIDFLKKQDVLLPDSWQFSNTEAIAASVKNSLEARVSKGWQDYLAKSTFAIPQSGLDRIAFAGHPNVQKQARQQLQQFYIADFAPGLPESVYINKWLAQQNNISFIRMVTSTAMDAAFSPGGLLFDIGNQAVHLSVILPLSITLSFFAIVGLLIKFGRYLWPENKLYFGILSIFVAMFFVMPIVSSMTKADSYSNVMAGLTETFGSESKAEYAKTAVFARFLDMENGLYSTYRNLPFVSVVKQQLFSAKHDETGDDEASQRRDDAGLLSVVRRYDTLFYRLFNWIPSLLSIGEINKPFDANLLVLSRDFNVGVFMGLYLDDAKVDKVVLPNFMPDTDLGLVLDQKIFLKTNKVDLARDFVSGFDNPQYWMSVADMSYLKQSVLNKMEQRLPTLLNRHPGFVQSLADSSKSGFSNILIIKDKTNKVMRCMAVPALSIRQLQRAVFNNQFPAKTLQNCKGVLSL